MSLLVETIRVENGKCLNIRFHNERMIRTLYEVFGFHKDILLENLISVPEFAESGIFKCRVEYDHGIRRVEFMPYIIKKIRSLKLIEDNIIQYSHKFVDRSRLGELYSRKGDADDILIIKNGMVTDTSYANVILRDSKGNWVTPLTYLLPGTRRASLLNSGIIKEVSINHSDIKNYTEVKLINAMIGIDDTDGIPIGDIF